MMDDNQRISLVGGIVFIGAGALLLALNLIFKLPLAQIWPVVFFILAAGFCAPPFIWSRYRRGLAGLIIPGVILLTLGLIFVYNTQAPDWGVWAYAWTLIPAGVGLSLALAAWVGGWGQETAAVGLWMLVISAGVFALLATLFGSHNLKLIGPALLILAGLLILVRGIIRNTRK
jgi:hypothetical protein